MLIICNLHSNPSWITKSKNHNKIQLVGHQPKFEISQKEGQTKRLVEENHMKSDSSAAEKPDITSLLSLRPTARIRKQEMHQLFSLKPSPSITCFSLTENANCGPKEQHLNFLRTLAPPLMAAAIAISPMSFPPVSLGQTVDIQKGATLFSQACIGCHDAGGNIIQPGATLFLKDLERNGVATEEEIYRITSFGKGRMPGFGENCTPRGQCTFGPRLQEEDIKLLAAFVKLQADQGWSNTETGGD